MTAEDILRRLLPDAVVDEIAEAGIAQLVDLLDNLGEDEDEDAALEAAVDAMLQAKRSS